MMRSEESCGSAYDKKHWGVLLEISAVLPNLFRRVLIVLECPLCYHQKRSSVNWQRPKNGRFP